MYHHATPCTHACNKPQWYKLYIRTELWSGRYSRSLHTTWRCHVLSRGCHVLLCVNDRCCYTARAIKIRYLYWSRGCRTWSYQVYKIIIINEKLYPCIYYAKLYYSDIYNDDVKFVRISFRYILIFKEWNCRIICISL